MDVHKAARIMAAAHGGQVVVSAATAKLAAGDLTPLGEHRLKDFDEPVALFQLGDDEFPPLKTISNTNLPRPASSFVGRANEVAEVTALLRDGTRLVTLTAPGGSGKTRLAIESASELVGEFKAGPFWVGLAHSAGPPSRAARGCSRVLPCQWSAMPSGDAWIERIREAGNIRSRALKVRRGRQSRPLIRRCGRVTRPRDRSER